MPEAIGAWRKAADKGSTSAMVELGVLYGTGSGVARDEAQARKLFERAAEAGNPRGVTNLAALGDGGAPADPARARELLAKAAETNAEAQYQLGLMMADGAGGPKDDAGARACSRRLPHKITPARWSGWARSPGRPRRSEGFRCRQGLLRARRSTRRRRRQEGAEANGMPLAIKDKRGNLSRIFAFR